jgi:hypothetical protein
VNRRLLLALIVTVVCAAAVAGAVVIAAGAGDGAGDRVPALRAIDAEQCRGFAAAETRDCYTRELLALVDGREDPRPAVSAITEAARSQGGFLLSNCHVIMHGVGRAYAADAGVTLETLMEYLPADNDPGCPAGFAHGLVTAVAPDIDVSRPSEAASVCTDAGTRFQRYSCVHGFGHAFMRLYDDVLEPALKLCSALGPQASPDCAQGAFHDYWFAVVGADEATLPEGAVTDPRALCGAQPAAFVRPCWYRAFLERRPEGFELAAAEDLDGLCAGVAGLQREACITGASVIGPPDPAAQLRICSRLREPSDAANCIRGTKVQNLLDAPTAAYVKLLGGCERFGGTTRAGCYRWLGKALAVITDGSFARAGCPRLAPAARRECEAGAATMEQALVTFS